MSHVNVIISGRKVRMACDDGQENHLTGLAADFDQRIAKLRESYGEIGEAKLTIMAALTMADELAEVSGRLRRLEAEFAALQSARAAAVERAQATQAALSAALTAAAERIEGMAKRLNQTPRSDNGGVAMG
jgi:cell division protein ZapA